MIYNNQGGNIGFSSSSLPQTTKKLLMGLFMIGDGDDSKMRR